MPAGLELSRRASSSIRRLHRCGRFALPGEDPYAGFPGFLDHGVRCIGDVGHLLLGDGVHRAVIERDQIPGHLTLLFLGRLLRPLTLLRTRAQERLTDRREIIGLGQIQARFLQASFPNTAPGES